MTTQLSQEGTFKLRVDSWGIIMSEAPSKSVGITMQLTVVAEFDYATKTWTSWLADEHGEVLPPVSTYGTIYIIGREGQENPTGIEHAVDALAWNGDLMAFKGKPPENLELVADVKREVYQPATGAPRVSFKPSWWYPASHNPAERGGLRNVASADDIAKLSEEMGARFRAAVAGRKK